MSPTTKAVILVDNANTFIGAQRTQSGDNRRLRLNLPSLDKLLVGQCLSHGFGIGNKLAFGVVKPSSRVIEQSYQNLGYQTHFQVSTTKQDTNGELKKALMSILESKPTSSLSCIALVSGDGSCRGGNSIPDILENGLKNGWHCILFAWNHTLSKQFLRLNERYGRQMRIIYLDDYRASIMMFSTPPQSHAKSPQRIHHASQFSTPQLHSFDSPSSHMLFSPHFQPDVMPHSQLRSSGLAFDGQYSSDYSQNPSSQSDSSFHSISRFPPVYKTSLSLHDSKLQATYQPASSYLSSTQDQYLNAPNIDLSFLDDVVDDRNMC